MSEVPLFYSSIFLYLGVTAIWIGNGRSVGFHAAFPIQGCKSSETLRRRNDEVPQSGAAHGAQGPSPAVGAPRAGSVWNTLGHSPAAGLLQHTPGASLPPAAPASSLPCATHRPAELQEASPTHAGFLMSGAAHSGSPSLPSRQDLLSSIKSCPQLPEGPCQEITDWAQQSHQVLGSSVQVTAVIFINGEL